MSPRFDHRPPVIAFVFLVLIAVAVIGSSARAVDGHFFRAGPVRVTAHAEGVARTPPTAPSTRRVIAPSRSAARPPARAVARPHATVRQAKILTKRAATAARHRLKWLRHAAEQHGHAWGHIKP